MLSPYNIKVTLKGQHNSGRKGLYNMEMKGNTNSSNCQEIEQEGNSDDPVPLSHHARMIMMFNSKMMVI